MRFRTTDAKGEISGGPQHYLQRGIRGRLVPFMILCCVLGALFVLLVNVAAVPQAVALILTDAFTGTAAARTTHPVRQGPVSMTQTFIDTIVVVTRTGLVLITTGVWEQGADHAATMTGDAFSRGLPGERGHVVVTLGLVLFAYSTILGRAYYGKRCMERLFGRAAVMPYRVVFSLVVLVGCTVPLAVVWNFADVMDGLMAIPNLVGLLVLSGLVTRETQHYLSNDPRLRANRQEVEAFMDGHPGAIDSCERTDVWARRSRCS